MKKLTFSNLPHQEHADLLDDLEAMADEAYTMISNAMVAEVLKILKKEKLSKSDLPRGWTGEVPKIEVNFDELLSSTIGKYLDALKYILLGKLAGKDAVAAAKLIGVDGKVIPGIVQGAYLDSVDTQRVYGEKLTGDEPGTIQKELLKETAEQLQNRTSRFMNESLMRLQNRIIAAVELEAQKVNNDNLEAVIDDEKTSDKMPKSPLEDALEEAAESHRTDWGRLVNASISVASAVGTHQAVQEIYARDDDDVRVAWVAMRDEKTCQFCKNASRNPDGSFKLYRMSDFMPAGYNYSRKRAEWKLCIPPGHPNCRCSLIYKPRGFEITNDGTIQPKQK